MFPGNGGDLGGRGGIGRVARREGRSGARWWDAENNGAPSVFLPPSHAPAFSLSSGEGREEREIGVEGEWDDKSQTLIVIYKEHGNGLIWTLIGLSLLTEAGLYNVSVSENMGIN